MSESKDLFGAIAENLESPSFEAFWEAYPRHTEKAKAIEAFARLSPIDQINATKGAEYHAKFNPQWRNPKLVPHATTFLNRRRWEDEIVEDIDAKARVHASISTAPAMGVWKAMVQMFGQPWIDRHGESPPTVWVTQLSKVTEGQIKRGLRATADSGAVFPPSLPEFLANCRAQSSDLPEFKALPRPYSPLSIADPAFEELRAILGYRL